MSLRHCLPKEPPHVPTVLPTVGAMDYSILGYSRNPAVVRIVVRLWGEEIIDWGFVI